MDQASENNGATATTVDSENVLNFSEARRLFAKFNTLVGWKVLFIVFATSSTVFWLLFTFKILRPKFRTLKWCAVPLVLMLVSGAAIYQQEQFASDLAVIVAESIELKSGDGLEFPTESNLESTSAMLVSIVGNRAGWCKIKLANGQTGWLPKTDLERVSLTESFSGN